MYHLLHASNHFKALMLMKGVMYNQGVAGSFSYFGPDEARFGKDQARLDPSDATPLKNLLRNKFAGRELSFEDVMKETWETPYAERNYRQAIRLLQADDLAEVKPVSSKTPSGLKDKDLVLFR